MTVADVLAIIISVIALGFSLYQFFVERKRNRDEATINALAELQKEVLNQEEFVNANVSGILSTHKSFPAGRTDENWEKISESLARIEQFAVGVNAGVYNLEILDRMAGSHILKEFYRYKPIIDYKRKVGNTNKRYIEFESMANSLKKYNPDIKPSDASIK